MIDNQLFNKTNKFKQDKTGSLPGGGERGVFHKMFLLSLPSVPTGIPKKAGP